MKGFDWTSAPEFITEFETGISNPLLKGIFQLSYAIGIMALIAVVTGSVSYLFIKGIALLINYLRR